MAGEAAAEVVLDAAVLIAAERDASSFRALRAAFSEAQIVPVVPAPVLSEVWRDGSRQANLARAMKAMTVADCDERIGRRAGGLLSATGGANTVDAIVVATAEARHCSVITGDVDDLTVLAAQAIKVDVIPA